MRVFKAVAAIAAVLGAGTAVAVAQAPVPTVTVTAGAELTATPVPVAPGATRFVFTSDLEAEQGVFLATPKPGRTVDEAIAAVRSNPESSFEVADIVASASLPPGVSRAVTVQIEEGRAYMLVSDKGEENSAQWAIAPLATGGAPTGATAPRPDATVTMRDVRFGGATTLPRRGTIRMRNIGWAPHFAIAAQLRPNARQGAVARALRGNRERALGQLLNFRNSVEVTSILTRNAVADNEVRFPARGRYVMVCFFEGHNTQGMYRFVRVR